MSDMRDDPKQQANSTVWVIGFVAAVLLLVAAVAFIAAEGEVKTAANTTPGMQSPVNNPPPAPPREREPQKSEPQ